MDPWLPTFRVHLSSTNPTQKPLETCPEVYFLGASKSKNLSRKTKHYTQMTALYISLHELQSSSKMQMVGLVFQSFYVTGDVVNSWITFPAQSLGTLLLLSMLGLRFKSQYPGWVLSYTPGSSNHDLWFSREAGRKCLGGIGNHCLEMEMCLFLWKAVWCLILVINLIELEPIRDMPPGSVRVVPGSTNWTKMTPTPAPRAGCVLQWQAR